MTITRGSTNAISADSSSSLTLYGSLSYDPDGGLLSYQWSCLTDTSQMKGGVTYTFTLMVSVEKKDKNYSSSKSVVYIVHGSSAPTIRMVTIRHNFRHDRPIMIKAEVSKDVAVAWRFVPNLWDYDWLNADLPAVGRASNLTTDWFTWYTIQPGALTPGRKYKMEVKAINAGDEVETTHEHVVNADVNQHTQDIVEELEQQDDLLNAIEIMAASPPTKSDLQHSLQTRAVGHIERLLTKDPSPGDMLLQTAKDMSHLRGGKNPDYRKMDDLVTCINIRRMRNEDVSCFDTPDSSHCFLVNALDDVGEFLNVKFPEEMMETKYRDLWNCGVDQVCHGVGIKYEKYPTEPPDLLVRRSDTECATYTYLDLYNQLTGTRIPVKDLAGVIEITIGETACPRPECYFYDEFNKRFSTEGVITKLINKTLVCETNHLTGFTLRSKPPLYDGFNMPYVVTCVVVALVFAFAFVLLVRAFIILNSYPSKEEENDLAYFRESESPDLRVKT
ncbi:hypothetical protein MAR_009741 [Mya arenaria]|uniref:PKD/REJ-like domain-containing protein n=1 Tax=Mya arenaria TaxID=6604 RepID=A0ABY7DZQ2_MYAAR|nr:hypothetical protein MAR_009741 [Mya arenaria]